MSSFNQYCTCGHSIDEHSQNSISGDGLLLCDYYDCKCPRWQPQLTDALLISFLKEAHRLARDSRYRITSLQLSPFQSSLRSHAEMLSRAETALTLAMHSIEPLVDALTATEEPHA